MAVAAVRAPSTSDSGSVSSTDDMESVDCGRWFAMPDGTRRVSTFAADVLFRRCRAITAVESSAGAEDVLLSLRPNASTENREELEATLESRLRDQPSQPSDSVPELARSASLAMLVVRSS